LQPAAVACHEANVTIVYQHIPREHNPVADKLANEGADAVIDGTYASKSDINGNIIRPGTGRYYERLEGFSK
jgi:hypothetical protein